MRRRKMSPVEWTGVLLLACAGLIGIGPPDPRDQQVSFLFWWIAVPLIVIGEVLRQYGRHREARRWRDSVTPGTGSPDSPLH